VLRYLVEEKGVRIDDSIKDNDDKTTLDHATDDDIKAYLTSLPQRPSCGACNP